VAKIREEILEYLGMGLAPHWPLSEWRIFPPPSGAEQVTTLNKQSYGYRLPGAEIFPWTTQFMDKTLEDEFQASRAKDTLAEIRIWGLSAIAFYIIHSVLEWFLIPDQLRTLLIARCLIAMPIFIAAWILSYTSYIGKYLQAAIIICVGMTGLGYLMMFANVPNSLSGFYSYLILAVVLFLHGHMGIRFSVSVICSILLMGGYFLVVLSLNPIVDPAMLFQSSLLFVAISIIVMFIHYNYVILAHRNYRHALVLSRQIEERKEVEKNLQSARKAAEIANRTKSLFLANMSHELRTPLNAISGFSDIMERELYGSLGDPRYSEYARYIHGSGEHLLAIIGDILDLSRIEAGQDDLDESEVALADIIDACLPFVRERVVEAKVHIHTHIAEGLPHLRVDVRRVKQILINLLSNAIKFTDPGGSITIRAAADKTGAVAITVRDTGIGMRPEDIPGVLEPFGQIDASLTRKYEGTGLGLTLVRQLTEAHGGILKVDSELGIGTTITVRFPAERSIAPTHRLERDVETEANAC
jgi:two-component system, cell cycle sensor histidine kinase PleC